MNKINWLPCIVIIDVGISAINKREKRAEISQKDLDYIDNNIVNIYGLGLRHISCEF